MGRKRKQVHHRKAEESDYDSDDDRAYRKMPAPNPDSQDFYLDEVDEFNETRDKIPLERDGRFDGVSDSDNQEEVLPLDYSDSSDDNDIGDKLRRIRTQEHLDEMASDLEEEGEGQDGEEAGLPDAKAWGKRKKEYYNTDYVDDDLPGMSGSEEEAAQEEEEREALAIQKRMSQMMEEADFDLQLFQDSRKTQDKKLREMDEEAEEKVVKDLSKLSKRQKLEILRKESPEFLELVEDFKVKLKEVTDRLYPLLGLVKDGTIPEGLGADYINTKFKLYMNYCVNISFYMTLKAKHVPIHNHPIIGRILAHKKLIKELEPLDHKLEPEIQSLLSENKTDEVKEGLDQKVSSHSVKNSKNIERKDGRNRDAKSDMIQSQTLPSPKTKPSSKDALAIKGKVGKTGKRRQIEETAVSQERSEMTPEEVKKALEFYDKMAKEIQERKLEKRKETREIESQYQVQNEARYDEIEEDGKRAITYQISKNKGLTPHRKKEQRNPRVKHRMKFKKAKVRRKGQVREVRTELTRYGGEVSGIRAGVIKSVKIK